MEYIDGCLSSGVVLLIMCSVILIYEYINIKKNMSKSKKELLLAITMSIILLPASFSDLRFYYEFYNSPQVEDVIEIDYIENKKMTPSYTKKRKRRDKYNAMQLVYAKDGKEFLMLDELDDDMVSSINNRDMNDIIQSAREEGLLSDLADNYLETVTYDSKFKVKYIETKRHNVVVAIDVVEE